MQPAEILDEVDNPRKAAAVSLLERGFHVFAVKAGEKRPDPLLALSGFLAASTDAETVGGWFDAKPKANLGVAAGADYGIVVLDVDVKNGAPGMATYAELGLGNYTTLTARTPSGGYHLYFKHPGAKLKAKLPGLDVKGAGGGGYVLAPPSTLPNGEYAWLDPEMRVAEMPFELVAQLEVVEKAEQRNRKVSPADGLKTQQGQRHTRLVELAAVYRGKGLESHEVEALLWYYAERYFEPPFGRDNREEVDEIEKVAYWAGKKSPNEPTETPLVPISAAQLFELADRRPEPAVRIRCRDCCSETTSAGQGVHG